MLKAIFYARFHTERGPSVIHQYPASSILSPPGGATPLLEWSDIQAYIIPPYEVCNQPLAICTNDYRVLTFPVSIEDAKYERNRFTFNICFVLAEDQDARPWNRVVRKTAAFLRALEAEDELLQAEERLEGLKWAGEQGYPARGVGVVESLLETIFEDMNRYGETCIPIDTIHILNLGFSSPQPAPSKVQAWDVPLLIRPLPQPAEWTWDLTLQRIHPYLDGVNHVKKIAEQADVELKLVKRAVRELIFHGRAALLDIFHFQAVYVCTPELVCLVNDQTLQDECAAYVAVPSSHRNNEADSSRPTPQSVIDLYCSLEPGVCLAEFYKERRAQLANIDLRRFIGFGVMRGFLKRLHKYVLATGTPPPPPSAQERLAMPLGHSLPKSNEQIVKDFDRAWRKAALSSGWATPPSGPPLAKSLRSAEAIKSDERHKLSLYLDGNHCLDQICVEMHLDEKTVLARLQDGRFGDLVVFSK